MASLLIALKLSDSFCWTGGKLKNAPNESEEREHHHTAILTHLKMHLVYKDIFIS